jgi:hypothetical protein
MTDGDPTLDRARDGLDHLQAAARELIAAARAALDVAEGLIDDPEVAKAMTGAAGRIGQLLRNVLPAMADRLDPDATRAGDGDEGPAPSHVQRIVVD